MDEKNYAHLLRFGVLKPHSYTRRSLNNDDDSFSGPTAEASSKPLPLYKRDVKVPEKDLFLYIPKDRKEWMRFVIDRIKEKVPIQYSTDKELEMTILRAKKVLASKKVIKLDQDMPDCYYWSVEEVCSWIDRLGYPDVKKMFHANSITGRLLVHIDASALNQMGLRDLSRMLEVTSAIRKLLEIPPPNAMRAIMRLLPWELYLKRKSRTGPITDALTFKEFCRQEGFPYEAIMQNHKSAVMPPVCTVEIQLPCPNDTSNLASSCRASSSGSSSSSSYNSLKYCHTTEQIVRKLPDRDAIIQQVLTTLLQSIIHEIKIREANALAAAGFTEAQLDGEEGLDLDLELDLEERVRRIYFQAYLDLAIQNPERYEDQVKFVAEVTLALVSDITRTRQVFQDIEKFQRYLEESLESGILIRAREIAGTVLEEIAPIAALLSLGQLEPEKVIRQAPGILTFVQDIVDEAEKEIDHRFPSSSSDLMRVPSLLSETKERLLPTIKKVLASSSVSIP